jgi:hypothetical protein
LIGLKTFDVFPNKLYIELPNNQVVPLIGIYRNELKTDTQTKTYLSIYLITAAALFTIAKRWKQSSCPSTEWKKKIWYIHPMEYY